MVSNDPNKQAGLALLAELSDSEIAWLRTAGERRLCDGGTVLVESGTRIETLYLVLSGVLSVSVGGAQGREIARLGPGQIIGEMSFLEDRPASATVRALEESEVLALPRAVVEAKLEEDMAFSAHLYRGLAVVASRRLRDAVGQIERWLGAEPVAEDATRARWSEIARRTQEFKSRLVEVSKLPPAELDAVDLAGPLCTYSAALDSAIGPDSPETVDTREELGARVQRELLPYFLKACTPAQLFEKPRGYPGDFHAMEMIHSNKPDGKAPLGPSFDKAFLALPAMNAFRASRRLLQNELRQAAESSTGGPVQITAVGAAPAAELFGMVAVKGTGVNATLIEFDPDALHWLQTNRSGTRIRFELESLVNLALGQEHVQVEGQDFAYTLLISSFSDRFAVGLLNYLHGLLKPGGRVCVASLHPRNPDKTLLTHVLGWNIVHRDENAMNTLFERSAFRRAGEKFTFDEQGLFYLATCQKS
ncbi:cyclic nucleotide-binding protein [Chthoniobacter flavus Ellin428]|uniref:Cyclic nucleotide-binding protein n=1 Tax=Chthoniobacter flavus Ellin428 TaxID=497964 RepID=B4D1R2_9BACT|nr:cyclic nucleotide-binding domain-containing protein [Chthoniobacter flavus]EDY19674.1 cyclic nucleotide-binding protein [Chthoniobacter flavus Ellin428]TCO92910.1 cyclic nucleotide-binding protein [Chthoniobacter flavus]